MLLFAPYKKKQKFFSEKSTKSHPNDFKKYLHDVNVWAPKNNDNKKVHLNCRQTNTHKKIFQA